VKQSKLTQWPYVPSNPPAWQALLAVWPATTPRCSHRYIGNNGTDCFFQCEQEPTRTTRVACPKV
jgi:hypothetical protein